MNARNEAKTNDGKIISPLSTCPPNSASRDPLCTTNTDCLGAFRYGRAYTSCVCATYFTYLTCTCFINICVIHSLQYVNPRGIKCSGECSLGLGSQLIFGPNTTCGTKQVKNIQDDKVAACSSFKDCRNGFQFGSPYLSCVSK